MLDAIVSGESHREGFGPNFDDLNAVLRQLATSDPELVNRLSQLPFA